jgi:hypothetical protein
MIPLEIGEFHGFDHALRLRTFPKKLRHLPRKGRVIDPADKK